MNYRAPTVTLTADESDRVRTMMRERGAPAAARALGNVDVRTLYRAASEAPIARLSAQVIRHSLERL